MSSATLRLAAAACVLVPMLAACSSTPRSSAPRSGYVEQYATGQYAAAYDSAVEAAGQERGSKRDQAALTAGLSAHALGRNTESVRWLAPLENNPDPGVAGKACATLGLIAQERGEHDTAVRLLTRASSRLHGDEAARAAMYAGDSLRALGKPDEAKKMYEQAQRKLAGDENLRMMIADRQRGNVPTSPRGSMASANLATRTLTVQTGAFRDRKTAQQQASKIAQQRGVAARVVPILKDGQTLYAVRIGSFSNRDAAENIRRTVGGNAVVTVASGE